MPIECFWPTKTPRKSLSQTLSIHVIESSGQCTEIMSKTFSKPNLLSMFENKEDSKFTISPIKYLFVK